MTPPLEPNLGKNWNMDYFESDPFKNDDGLQSYKASPFLMFCIFYIFRHIYLYLLDPILGSILGSIFGSTIGAIFGIGSNIEFNI